MSFKYPGSGLSSATSSLPPLYRRFLSSAVCDNAIYGCTKRLTTLEERQKHKVLCEFEPTTIERCDDCHKEMQRSQLKRHNCIKELRTTIDELKQIITDLEVKVNEQTIHLNDAKEILDSSPVIKDFNHNYSSDDQKRQEVFESEPQIHSKVMERYSTDSCDSYVTDISPEVSYKRYNKEISTEADFGMYGSLKYKYLSQLSREFSGLLPPIDYDFEQTIDEDLKKKNTSKLIDVIKDKQTSGQKPVLFRLRSWSERDN